MKITINDQYYIDFDGTQYTPFWFKEGGEQMKVAGRDITTKDEWKTSGKYFTKLESAIHWVVSDSLVKGDDLSLGEFVAQYREAWEDIKKVVKL